VYKLSLTECDRKHAYSDLKPYVCCGGKGECDLELFSSRNTWFTHELESHRYQWICFLCQQEPLTSLARFQSHVQNKHVEIPVSQIPEVAQICKRPLQYISAIDCPFCDDFEAKLRERGGAAVGTEVIVVPAVIFRRHVAAHLEQLALFSLGPQNQPDEEMENGSVESRSDGSVRDADVMEHFLNDQEEFEQDDPASFSLELEVGPELRAPPSPKPSAAEAESRLDDSGPLIKDEKRLEAMEESGNEVKGDDEVERQLAADFVAVEKGAIEEDSNELKRMLERQAMEKKSVEQLEDKPSRGTEKAPAAVTPGLDAISGGGETQPTDNAQLDTYPYIVPRVRALFDFEPSEPDELQFEKGDIIQVKDAAYKMWWRGTLRGETGIFPLNYVEKADENGAFVPRKPDVSHVRGLYDFQISEPGELQFQKGDIITVLETIYKDWWKGSLNGQTGVFPVNYVEKLPEFKLPAVTSESNTADTPPSPPLRPRVPVRTPIL
jgi:hypothetical protein